LLDEPEVITRGFVSADEMEEIIAETRQLVRKTVDCTSNGRLQNDLEQSLKSFLYTKTKRRPMVFVTISNA
jgi:mRNA degradation ribonuclease J1/J2